MVFKVFVFSVFMTVTALYGMESGSVHFSQSLKFRNVPPPVFYGEPSLQPASLSAKFQPVTEKLIFGYLPYWNNSTTHLRWGLLTDLLYFSCEMESGGILGNCNGWPESAPIDEARKYGVRVHLVITSFNKDDILGLLGSPTQKETFFDEVWNKVKNHKADGVNIDFEAFGAVEPRTLLTNFFNDLSNHIKSKDNDMIISAAIPAVDWSDNWDLAGMTNVDYFFIMLYDYHWRGGEPGPVAPLLRETPWPSWTRSVTRSIDDYVDANGVAIKKKLIAGYPYYGYKWKTVDASIPGTKVENAVSVIYDKVYSDYFLIDSLWDDGSMTPYKIWKEGDDWYQLWYDDATSLGLKFALADAENLAGSGMWALNYDTSKDDLWKEIARYFVNSEKGSFQEPVAIDKFPFIYEGDTYRYVSYEIDSYSCLENPDNSYFDNLSGPEKIFRIDLNKSGVLTAEITKGWGNDGEREDIDIFLLSGDSGKDCIIGSKRKFSHSIEKGTYFLSADSNVSDNVTRGGPFVVEIDFTPSEVSEENEGDSPEDDSDDHEIFDADKEIPDDNGTKESDDEQKGSRGCSITTI